MIGSDEAFGAYYDKLSEEDHTYVYTAVGRQRLETSWVVQLNSQGPNGPMKQREDYADAVKIKDRLYRESGGANPKIQPSKQVRQRADQAFSRSSEVAERVDPKTGWRWYPPCTSSSSSSWWTPTDEW